MSQIEIPASVTSIGMDAFFNCIKLQTITIPASVTIIKESAFEQCEALETVNFLSNSNLKFIEYCAFANCKRLARIEIPDSVTSIGIAAFSGCAALKNVKLPKNITRIDNWLFYNCSSLESVEIPASVTSIGSLAFYNCKALKSIEIPSNVTIIERLAFESCKALKSIIIPLKVIIMDFNIFLNCELTIYAEAASKPSGWASSWNPENRPVYFYSGIPQENCWHYADGKPAVWQIYTVTLNMQGGTGDDSSVSAANGAAMPSATAPSRTGLTFDGYYSAPNGRGIQYYDANMVSVRFYDIAGNTTLYAKWTATVTFDMQDGTGDNSPVTAVYGSTMPAATAPTRTGLTFGGYYSQSNGRGIQYYYGNMTSARSYDIAGDTMLYAKWTAIVTFDKQDGISSSFLGTVTYGAAMPAGTPLSRTGFIFDGYYTEPNGGGIQYYNAGMIGMRSYDIEGNITLYANWIKGSPSDLSEYEIYYEEIDLYAIVYSDGKFLFYSSEGGNYTLESCMRGCQYEIRVCIFEISSSDAELIYYFEEEYVLETIYLKAGVYYFFEINDESDFGIFILMLYQA